MQQKPLNKPLNYIKPKQLTKPTINTATINKSKYQKLQDEKIRRWTSYNN